MRAKSLGNPGWGMGLHKPLGKEILRGWGLK